MASIDERVVAMSFENAKFEAGVAQTMRTLQKLNSTLAQVGSTNGLDNIERAANKVTLHGPMSALDKLRARLFGASQGAAEGFSGIDNAGNKVSLHGPISALDRLRTRLFGASQGAAEGMAGIDAAGNKVTLQGPLTALDRLRARLFGVGTGAAQGFSGIERASNVVQLLNPLTAIDRLRTRLGGMGGGASKGFADIERGASRVTLGGIGNAIDGVNRKFSGMQVVAAGAIGGVVAAVTLKAKGLANALSLGPITQGLQEYTTNLNSIQTILANTKASGANLQDVNRALKELNAYSDQTIYNFSQMAKNIGTFTAAGVDLKTATGSIKGIANLAALSGSNSEQASTAMYQLSQAISAGRVSLQDWNSVVNAGMGGTIFQRALAQTAVAMGTLDKGAVGLKGKMKNVTIQGESFRESITAKPGQKSWLTSKVLTTALKNFTGDISLAEIKAQGFTTSQAKAIMAQAKTAKAAATEVKTLGGVFDVVKESIGSGWSATFQTIFGDFEEAKKLFTNLTKYLQNVIGNSANARNKILGDWKSLGGRTALIEGVKNVFKALLSVLKPIHDAFREIFPKSTGKDLYDLTIRFRDFAKSLAIGPETAKNLKRTFAGFFAVLHIGWTVVKGVIGVIGHLLGIFSNGPGTGLLSFTGAIGDFFVALDKAISRGKGFNGIFVAMANVLHVPLRVLGQLGDAIKGLFSGDKEGGNKLAASMDKVTNSSGPLAKAFRILSNAWGRIHHVFEEFKNFAEPILKKAGELLSGLGDAIVKGAKEVNYDRVMAALQAVLTGGVAIGIKKLLKGIGVDLSGGAIDSFKKVGTILTGTLTSIQKNVNAQTMLLIAAAVLALAAATVIFSHIDAKQLAKAMTAVAVGMGQLVGALYLLMAGGGKAAIALAPLAALAMMGIAAAMVILAAAVTILSKLSWNELIKGMSGIAIGILALAVGTSLMGPSLILIGPGLLAVASAMVILASAMKIMGGMSWGDMIKGLFGIGGALLAVGIGVRGLGPSLILIGPGLIAVSLGLILLSGAVSSFAAIGIFGLAKGIGGMAAALVVLGVAITAIPPTVAVQAIGLGLLSVALMGMAVAIGLMGSLGLATVAKGLITIAVALQVFAIGLRAMSTTLPGAAALLAAAAALAILTPVLVTLGALKIQTIVQALAAIAGVMLVIGGIGAVVAEPLLALGIALGVIAVAGLIAAAAVYLFATAIGQLGAEGSKGFGVLIAAITAFIALLPKMVIDFLKGLTEILNSLVTLAPQIASAWGKITTVFINKIIELMPKIQELMTHLVGLMVQVITVNAPRLAAAGFHLLVALINQLANNVGPVVSGVARFLTNLLNALASRLPRLIAAGGRAAVAWIRGMTGQLPRILAAGSRMIGTFLLGIAQRIPGIVARAAQLVAAFLNAVARQIPKVVAAGVRVIVSYINAIANGLPRIIRAGTNLIIKFVDGIARAVPRIVNAGFRAIIHFLNGVAKAIRDNDDAMINAGWNIASAIGTGMIKGLTSVWPRVMSGVTRLVHLIPKRIRDILHIHSPSQVMVEIGMQTMEGMRAGIANSGPSVVSAVGDVANNVVDAASSAMALIPAGLANMEAMNPVITPVLDLSNVETEAKRIAAMTQVGAIDPSTSLTGAAAIAAEVNASKMAQLEALAEKQAPSVTLEQNNYSPESLSEIEIYRQTNNQLSQLKSALALP